MIEMAEQHIFEHVGKLSGYIKTLTLMSGDTLTGALKSLGILVILGTRLVFENQRSLHREPKKYLSLVLSVIWV